MHIDHHEFGRIVIDGQTYRNDLLIWPVRSKAIGGARKATCCN
jgi:hypothetical protein